MISEDKIIESLNVARKCYKIAKEKYNISEDNARILFIMGLLQNIGYEFSNEPNEQSEIAFDILMDLSLKSTMFQKIIFAIKNNNKNIEKTSIIEKVLEEANL